jgi:hypothetical protein
MAITGIPTFTDNEIPPASKLNALGDAITNKFGGAVDPSDLTWPFLVDGNIDFVDTYTIVGLRSFWNIINAGEYPLTAAGFQAAIDAAVTAGGGCVVIPPDTSITADGIDFDESNITIMGFGKSSELKTTTGASSGYLLRTGTSGLSNIIIENLTLNGQSVASQKGVVVRDVDGFKMINVLCKNFDGVALELTNSGVGGVACTDAHIIDCTFSGGGAGHITGDDIDGLAVMGCKLDSAAATAIDLEPAGASSLIKRIFITNVDIETVTGSGVSILGGSGTADDKWSLVDVHQVNVTGATADGFILGAAAKFLKHTTIIGCSAPSAGGDGINIATEGGLVMNNYCPAATTNGIDTTGSTGVQMLGNEVTGSGTDYVEAVAHVGPFMSTNSTQYLRNAGETGDMGYSLDIPASTVKVGDVVRIKAFFEYTHVDGTVAARAMLEGVSIGGFAAIGTSTGFSVEWVVHIEGLTGANTYYTTHYVGATDLTDSDDNTITVDWTNNVDITFDVSAKGANSVLELRGVTVEILGGIR